MAPALSGAFLWLETHITPSFWHAEVLEKLKIATPPIMYPWYNTYKETTSIRFLLFVSNKPLT